MLFLALILQEAEHAEEGGGLFAVEPGLIVWTWIVFIALFLVLRKYAWPALLSATEEREKRIARQLQEAERQNSESTKLLEEHRALVANAREEALELIGEARTAAVGERQQILEKARADQEQMIDRAKREIDAEKDRAISDLRREAVDLSLAAASRLVGERLDDDANRKLVREYLGSLEAKH